MSAGRGSDDLELRGEGGNLRLLISSKFRSGKIPPEARDFLEKATPIMKGADIIVDLRGEGWIRNDIIQIMDRIISPADATVAAWTAEDPEAISWMKASGLAVYSRPENNDTEGALGTMIRSLLVEESLRSGRKVEYAGDVVVLGNINDGAEVIAGGSIIVMGRLRGLAHAGLENEDVSFIVAGQFETNQVRIGGKISYIDDSCAWWGKCVTMRLNKGTIDVREMSV